MVRCDPCGQELRLIAGHTTIRLYRCSNCGSQQILPGDAVTLAEPTQLHAPNAAQVGAQSLPKGGAERKRLSPAVALGIALGVAIAVILGLRSLS